MCLFSAVITMYLFIPDIHGIICLMCFMFYPDLRQYSAFDKVLVILAYLGGKRKFDY